MAEIHSPVGSLPKFPDHLSIPQFLLDHYHPTRPTAKAGSPWLIDDNTRQVYGLEEIRRRTFGLANSLCNRFQICEADVVLIFSRNHIDYPIAIWAVHRLGGVISGANPDYTTDELLYQLKATRASLLIAHPDVSDTALVAGQQAGLPAERIICFDSTARPAYLSHVTISSLVKQGLSLDSQFIEHPLKPGEAKTKLAFLSFSSGTTGRPKAVAIPHIAVIANVIQMAVHNKVNEEYTVWSERRYRPGDVCIGVLPFYHIYGLVINLHYILYCGMSVVVTPRFDFVSMLKSIVRHRITHLMLVPPQVVLLCKHPAVKSYDLSIVRFIMAGAAPLTMEVTRQLYQLFPDAHIGQAYGMTETCTATTMWPINQKHAAPGSGGQLLPGIVARVIKTDGTLAGYNEPGELIIKTPSVALGYDNDEIATKETFIDGWVRTGDEVYIDRNAEIWVVDRIKEIMKVRGFQVAPAELEGSILDHPDVSDVCVVGVPDDYSGEVPMAFVVLTAQAGERVKLDPGAETQVKASVMKHVADKKVKYKQLAGGVEFIDAIPKNPSGKLLRRVLRDQGRKLVKTRAKL